MITFKSLFAVAGHGRRAISFCCALAGVVALAAPACNSSSAGPANQQSETCALNSDCAATLVCAFGKCRAQCQTDADCPGGTCVIGPGPGDSGNVASCQSSTLACNTQANCPAPLACATDYRCRNLCTSDGDCNVLGITGDVCAEDLQGVHYCASMSDVTAEVVDGGDGGTIYVITDKAPSGATGTVTEPDGSTSSSPDATTSGSSGSSGGSGSGGASSGGSGSGGSSSGSGAGGCTGETVSVDGGACVACGASGDPCCSGATCGSNLTCVNGTCSCGGPGESCCSGSSCNNGVTCSGGVCACGAAGAACCPSGAGAQCTGALQCAGVDCTCQVACSGTIVQRSDGTLWQYTDYYDDTPTPVQDSNSVNVVATSFSAYYDTTATSNTSGGSASGLGCYVSGGNVYCWGSNSEGQLGHGVASSTLASSLVPVEVLTNAVGSVALTNIKSVYVDNTEGYVACAIDTNTDVWCWGYGYYGALGDGPGGYNSDIAVQVTESDGSTPFSGAISLAVAEDHVCATTTGTLGSSGYQVYCWGYNYYGQIGQNNTTTQYYYYPTKVANLFSTAVNVSVGEYLTCATTTDGSVYCWGYNEYGAVGTGGTSSSVPAPFQVLLAGDGDAGAPFGGAVSVQVSNSYYGSPCARKADGSIWCWGEYSSTESYLPTKYGQNSMAVSQTFMLCPNGTSDPTFIDLNGNLNFDGDPVTTPITCP